MNSMRVHLMLRCNLSLPDHIGCYSCLGSCIHRRRIMFRGLSGDLETYTLSLVTYKDILDFYRGLE